MGVVAQSLGRSLPPLRAARELATKKTTNAAGDAVTKLNDTTVKLSILWALNEKHGLYMLGLVHNDYSVPFRFFRALVFFLSFSANIVFFLVLLMEVHGGSQS